VTTTDSPQLAYPVTSTSPAWAGVTSQGTVPPATVAASGQPVVPGCQRSSLSAVQTTPDPTIGGIAYDTVTATVRVACKVSGPPRLYVYNASGKFSTEVPVYRADPMLAPGLPQTNSWGRTLILGPGDKYSFEVAWAPATLPCVTAPSSAPTKSVDPSPAAPTTDEGAPPSLPPLSALASMSSSTTTPGPTAKIVKAPKDDYTLAYAVNGAPTLAMIPLVDGCGSAVYVTDIFVNDDVPVPEPVTSQSPS
jgi:hypothetical protein